VGSPFTITSTSNYNANPPSDDGAQTASNRVQWSTQKSKLSDPIKTAFDASETATSNAFGKVKGGAGITTTAVDYTIAAGDQGKYVKCTVSGKNITTPDATVVGSPFVVSVVNDSTGNITLVGNGVQTVDGVASFTIPAGAGVEINTDGSNWFTDGKNFFQAGAGIVLTSTTAPTTISAVLPNYLSGLVLSPSGGASTFGIAVGAASDSTNASLMQLNSAYTKSTASWVVGSGNGGLDTGAIATSTWYHVFLIQRPDTGVVDVLFSTSATTPTMPTNYTLKRRIGSLKTDGSSHFIAYIQLHDEFLWSTPVTDVNGGAVGVAAVDWVVSVPTGVQVRARIRGSFSNAAAGTGLLINSKDETSTAYNTPAGNVTVATTTNSSANGALFTLDVRTNTSAQIRSISSAASSSLFVATYGWFDTRGK